MAIGLMLLEAMGKVLLSMMTSLVTESFLKKAILLGLEKLVAAKGNDLEKQLLEAARQAWDAPALPPEPPKAA